MIKITKELLSEWFDKINNEFFNNELKKTNLEVFTKTPQYLPKDTPNTGIEAILAKYKK